MAAKTMQISAEKFKLNRVAELCVSLRVFTVFGAPLIYSFLMRCTA